MEKLNTFGDETANELVYSCVGRTLEAMASYTKREHTSLIWRCFYVTIRIVDFTLDFGLFLFNKLISTRFNKQSFNKNHTNQAKLVYLTRLLHLFLTTKNCYLIDDLNTLVEVFQAVFFFASCCSRICLII